MRKSFLLKRYPRNPEFGTKNMKHFRQYFGSHLLSLPKTLRIGDSVISWSQNEDGSQSATAADGVVPNARLDTVELKYRYSSIARAVGGTDEFPVWNVAIDVRSVLSEYAWASLRSRGTFVGIKTEMLTSNNVDFGIFDFIKENVLTRYKLSAVALYVKDVPVGAAAAAYSPFQDYTITLVDNVRASDQVLSVSPAIFVRGFEILKGSGVLDPVTLVYRQKSSAYTHTFSYHYDLTFATL